GEAHGADADHTDGPRVHAARFAWRARASVPPLHPRRTRSALRLARARDDVRTTSLHGTALHARYVPHLNNTVLLNNALRLLHRPLHPNTPQHKPPSTLQAQVQLSQVLHP